MCPVAATDPFADWATLRPVGAHVNATATYSIGTSELKSREPEDHTMMMTTNTATLQWHTGSAPIGTAEDARRALRGELADCGRGLFKRAVRSDDGATVYKYIAPRMRDAYVLAAAADNLVAEAAWSAYGIAHGVEGVPAVSLYRIDGVTVLAMAFVATSGREARVDFAYQSRMIRTWEDMGLGDLHDDNWRVNEEGRMIVTDMAGFGHHPREYVPCDWEDITDDCSDSDDCSDNCACGEHCATCCWEGRSDCCSDCAMCACGTGPRDACTGGTCMLNTRDGHCASRHLAASCIGADGHRGAGLTTRMRDHGIIREVGVTCGMPNVHTRHSVRAARLHARLDEFRHHRMMIRLGYSQQEFGF